MRGVVVVCGLEGGVGLSCDGCSDGCLGRSMVVIVGVRAEYGGHCGR